MKFANIFEIIDILHDLDYPIGLRSKDGMEIHNFRDPACLRRFSS